MISTRIINNMGFITVLIWAVVFSSCGDNKSITTDNVTKLTSVEFSEELYDWGSVTQGEKVNHLFKFKNTGDSDLLITSAKGSCGCTVPKWPKNPISPGGEDVIEVVFNSDGKKGKQHKKITIVANTEPSTNIIAITGEVVAPEKETEQ